MEKPKTNLEAYDLVMSRLSPAKNAKGGRPGIGTTMLADRLGVSRQMIHSCKIKGFPEVHVKKIAAMTGLPRDCIRIPAPVPIDLPAEIAQELIPVAKNVGISLTQHVINILRSYSAARRK